MAIEYRPARPEDAGPLAELFRDSFRETFGHLYDPSDLATFLAQHATEEWERQLADSSFSICVAEEGGALAGYVKLGPVELPIEIQTPAVEIRQFYVGSRWQGSGVAGVLMDLAVAEGRSRGAQLVYLSVYTGNHRAQRFYARHGFAIVGRNLFMVGNQADEDLIMKAQL